MTQNVVQILCKLKLGESQPNLRKNMILNILIVFQINKKKIQDALIFFVEKV
jgi:hypothetical protein